MQRATPRDREVAPQHQDALTSFYGVEATSHEFSLGMPPIGTADTAAGNPQRVRPPSRDRVTSAIDVCRRMMSQVYGVHAGRLNTR